MKTILADRYEVGELLGRGGMGWVQRAKDRHSGRDVAIKFMHSDDQPEKLATLFSWEIQALARLDHRGVLSVYDFGQTDEGKPYIVMALSDGRALSDIRLSSINWEAYRSLFDQLLKTLAHAHARGVFHHDLKPGNILVHRDGLGALRLHIIDFGIAGVMGHRGHGPTELVGTASYLAPEAVAKYALYRFSPSPDLYAVGVMAYELAYGIRPFVADDPREILKMHQTEPVPRRDFRDGFDGPKSLHRFILRMLEKRPRDRFNSATEVLAALRMLSGASQPIDKRKLRSLPGPRFSSMRTTLSVPVMAPSGPEDHSKLISVRPAPFSGREEALGVLKDNLAAVIDSNRPRVLLVTGASGAGKTRLVSQVAQLAAEDGRAHTVVVSFSLSGADSVEGWRTALLTLLGYAGARRDQLAEHLEADLEWLGIAQDIDANTVLDLLFTRQETQSTDTPGFDWIGTYLTVLGALARRTPIFIALDDITLVDDTRGIELLEFLLRRDADMPVFVGLTMRRGTDGAGIAEPLLQRLTRYPGFSVFRFAEMPDPDMDELIGNLIPLTPELRAQVVGAAGGLPIYATELMRYWVKAQRLQFTRDGYEPMASGEVDLPSSVADIWHRHIESVRSTETDGDALAAILGRAAVFGQPFTVAGLREVVAGEGRPDLARLLLSAWATWTREGLWEQVSPGKALFVHESVQAAALERLNEVEKRQVHRFSALALLNSSVGDAGPDVLGVARHYARAGMFNDAFPFFIRASRQAYRQGRFPASLSYTKLAAQLMVSSGASATDRRWAVICRILAESLMQLGRYAEAEETGRRLERASRAWQDPLQIAHALKIIAQARARTGDVDEAEPLLLQAQQLFAAQGVARELGFCHLELGEIRHNRKPPGQVRGSFQQARLQFRSVQEYAGEARAVVGEALVLEGMGAFAPAESLLEQALTLFRNQGDRHGMADAIRHRGRLALERGQHGRALDAQAEAAHVYGTIGSREGVALTVFETGHVYRRLGDYTQAERYFRGAREEFIALGNRPWSLAAHLGLVHLAVRAEQYEGSLPHLHSLVTELRKTGSFRLELLAAVLFARCSAEVNNWSAAAHAAQRVESLLGTLLVADVEVAHELEAIGSLAAQSARSDTASSTLLAALGIWHRLGSADDVARVTRLVDNLPG